MREPILETEIKTSESEVKLDLELKKPASKAVEKQDDVSPKIMRVRKRDGSLEPVNVNKIVNVVLASSTGLKEIDPMRVATQAISGLYDGTTTKELDRLCIQTAALLIFEEPEYSKLAARLLSRYINEEVVSQKILNFYDSARMGYELGLISKEKFTFIREHKEALNIVIDESQMDKLEYFGLRTLYDRYLLKKPNSREVIESPQMFFLRVACGLAQSFEEAKEFYDLISSLEYMCSSPTLFNSATQRPQLSSCYLLDSAKDDLEDIYNKYKNIALLSKYAGGIGVSFSRIRSRGSLIEGTNGQSNGLVPWIKTLDSSVAAVNQGGRRKGAACVYLETWHADLEEFLELRDNTGDDSSRAHNLNLAHWVPDLFMKRVEKDLDWSLFDPKEVPHFVDLYGDRFEKAYEKAEKEGLYRKKIKARKLYARMMKTLAQTGNGWMTFKDISNVKSNQTGNPLNVIHLSNLCTEILEITSSDEIAVCNLGSVNLSRHVTNHKFDFKKLKKTVAQAVKYLNRTIDINYYPVPDSEKSNKKWRPIGLGVMGLQDLFFQLQLSFDSQEALDLSAQIAEEIYYQALQTSCELAKKFGPHENFNETKMAKGIFQFDTWDVQPKDQEKWNKLKLKIKKHGLRNSLLIAVAPTATIASICGVVESIEPQVANFFKRETLSGEFIQVNKHLVNQLKNLNLWNDKIRNQIKVNEGSIQDIGEIPENIKQVFKTVWEIPQKALIDLAAKRGPFIDQSQSLNLFIESPSINKLSSMYMYAWKQGIKTTYYLRSRPATRITQVTVHSESQENNMSLDSTQKSSLDQSSLNGQDSSALNGQGSFSSSLSSQSKSQSSYPVSKDSLNGSFQEKEKSFIDEKDEKGADKKARDKVIGGDSQGGNGGVELKKDLKKGLKEGLKDEEAVRRRDQDQKSLLEAEEDPLSSTEVITCNVTDLKSCEACQ